MVAWSAVLAETGRGADGDTSLTEDGPVDGAVGVELIGSLGRPVGVVVG